MARKQKAEAEPEAPAMLALIETPDVPAPTAVDQARIILLDAQKFDQFYDKVKGETDAHVPDVSTPAGRQAIKSLAFRVTKTHTTLKSASLELTEAWRKQTAAVNAARGPMIERLTKLAADVRQPLTEWEEAEAARVQANRDVIDGIRADAVVKDDDTAASVAERGRLIWAMAFDAPQWSEDEAVEAVEAKEATVAVLVAAQKRLKVEEAEKAELAALRAEREARLLREQQEADAKALAPQAVQLQAHFDPAATGVDRDYIIELLDEAGLPETMHDITAEAAAGLWRDHAEARRVRLDNEAREAAEKVKRDAEEAEQRERDAEAKRIADREEAAEQARRDEKAKADAAQAERDAAHAKELQDAKDKAAEITAAAEKAIADRKRADDEREAEEKRKREAEEAEAKRIADEKAEADRVEKARQANRDHRGKVQREVKEAFMTCGISEDDARKLVLAIVAGNVPHCTVAF